LNSKCAGQVVIISVLEAKASRAIGRSGHETLPFSGTDTTPLTATL